MDPLTIGIGASLVLTAALTVTVAGGSAVKRFYIVPEADEALVRTGSGRPKVSAGGGLVVVPLLHKVTRVSLRAIRIPIDRRGVEALPTADKLMAEVVGELFVQVNPRSDADIVQAVQSIGTSDPQSMATRVRAQIDSLVTDALRTAAFKKSFLELNSQKKEFADEVIDLLQEDLAKLGLTLTAVSIPHIYQGRFTDDVGDVFAAEGRRNVAGTVEKNREETNRITRRAEIQIQQQDVEAREQALELELRQKQREADQARQVAEYEAEQRAETRMRVLDHEKATARAEALQAREVETAQVEEERQTEEARIEARRKLAVQEQQAEAAKRVAEEAALRQKEEAEIERAKAVETAHIAKERAVKVADELRAQAIAEAEINREIAIAQQRKLEAESLAQKAAAEAEQRRAEESIVTVRAQAAAAREKEVAEIHAEEQAAIERIGADRNAYVLTRDAQAQLDKAEKLAEAAKLEADARKTLALAQLEEGRAIAEARRLQVEAENAIASELVLRDVTLKALEVAPAVVHEIMAPVANVAHDVKILQVNGLGSDGGVEGLPATILNTGLAAAGVAPFLREATRAVTDNQDVQQLTGVLAGVATQAVAEAAKALREGAEPSALVDKDENKDVAAK